EPGPRNALQLDDDAGAPAVDGAEVLVARAAPRAERDLARPARSGHPQAPQLLPGARDGAHARDRLDRDARAAGQRAELFERREPDDELGAFDLERRHQCFFSGWGGVGWMPSCSEGYPHAGATSTSP